ncbi:MAG: SEC59/DGK1/VTE5 family protein [Ignavibacteria bacterium]|nr:SEC59/DGK1/VTE5 family protein [Ignavibacteria bacterium]
MSLEYKLNNHSTPFKGEIFRKLIHYSSAAISIGYIFLEKNIVLSVLVILIAFMLLFELTKYRSKYIHTLYMKYFKDMLREHEYDRKKLRINGATWVILSAIFCIILFPKNIAITGMLMLSFADSTSALLGRLYGKKQYAPNRSYVGTISFFATGTVIMLFAPKYFGSLKEYLICLTALIATTVVDSMSPPVDDNLTIPVTCCVVLYIMYIILYPGIIFQ